MSAEIRPRRGAAERVTGLIWGGIVTAGGAFAIAALSGYDVDLQLLAIVALAVLGGWLLASAVAAASRQSRKERAAFTVSEPLDDAPADEDLSATVEMPAEQTADTEVIEPEDRKDA
ncbi:hypothetical protein [Demequina soli]|uniref:hypothetical protein n=1 Tax=Demequina soli TaxID=1638987 RepID=UPI00078244BA|nr:hypothetical protein [Demequina soli]